MFELGYDSVLVSLKAFRGLFYRQRVFLDCYTYLELLPFRSPLHISATYDYIWI